MVAITNTQAGPRGLHTTEGYVSIEAGASITAEMSKAERASAETTGYFEFDDGDDLDGLKLPELIEVAKTETIDLGDNKLKADVLDAIRAARAGKEG